MNTKRFFSVIGMSALLCVLTIECGAVDLVKYDAGKGEYRRRDEQRTYIVGKIVNIAYELQHRSGGADSQDALFSKGRQGLMTSGGAIYTFVDNIKGQELQWKSEYVGAYVKVFGWIYHDAHYIEVDTFAVNQYEYVWNDKTNVFEAKEVA